MSISIKTIIIIGLLLRFAIAIWNGFFGPSPGADLDATGLNSFASNVATNGKFDDFSIGYIPYTNLLGLIYTVTINHIFIGSLLSCFAWFLSAHLLCKSFGILNVDKKSIKQALLIYSLLPSSVIYTAITIREPYQLLFMVFATYSAIQIIYQRNFKYYFLLIFSVFCFGVLHGALLAFGIIFFAGTIAVSKMRDKKVKLSIGFILSCGASVLVIWFGFSFFGKISYNLDGGLDNAILMYQQGLLSAAGRTDYKSDVALSSLSDLILFIPIGLFQYLFEPFPWKIAVLNDGIVALENILRFLLIWKVLFVKRIEQTKKRRLLNFIFISYILIETIWSIGTINWGTAVRHHLPALGFLLLAAFSASNRNPSFIKKVEY